MREIEFRGKRIDNGEWVHGYLLIYENEAYIFEEVDPDTVGQYTGLKDKNGKKIYEGDILSSDLGRPIVVEYKNGAFMLRCTYNENVYHDIFFPCDEVPQSTISWTEVIGNIHDNKELLEL